jgi:hypothetical protein
MRQELINNKQDALGSFVAQVNQALDSFYQDMKNDREDDFLQERENLQLASDTKIRQRRENQFSDFELMEASIRLRKDAEVKDHREKVEIYHQMDVNQIKAETDKRITMFKQRLLLQTGDQEGFNQEKQLWLKDIQDLITELEWKATVEKQKL